MYRPDSELYYLTGATEPGTVAVLTGGAEPRFVLFVAERDPVHELWHGPRLGPEAAAEAFGADEVHGLSELGRRFPSLVADADRIYFRLGEDRALQRRVVEVLSSGRSRAQRSGRGPRGVIDPALVLDELRSIKDEWEVHTLREAARMTVEGHRTGIAFLQPGLGEWAVEAAVEGSFRAQGATGPGFATIVGAGSNACILHYVKNNSVVSEGDLVLIDAGAEHDMYHGDVTRTVPAAGRFTPMQRTVYDVVDAARGAGVAACRPGSSIDDIHRAALRVIVEGLVDLGVVSGAVEDLIEGGAHRPYFPHNTSHWLGLDVHDPGAYVRDGSSRRLEPGMVLTVEPGLYFRAGIDGVPDGLSGIGVRVEDDVHVTSGDPENLTAGLPSAADEVEDLVGSG